MDGYAKWQQMGKYIKGEIKVNPREQEYANMGVEELRQRKEIAETWLKEHTEHINYQAAIVRYERLCDYLNLKEGLL